MATIIAPITTSVIEAIKRATCIKKRYLPLLSLVIGGLIGAAAYFIDLELGLRIWAGGISGLAATGLFEIGKNTMEDSG